MKKKIFLIVGSLGAGGAERVYWLLSQYFSGAGYDVSVIYLNGNEQCFSTEIDGVKFIDLKTVRTSHSFFPLLKLLKRERPFAVFSTTDNINLLVGLVACFIKLPVMIARASNNPGQMRKYFDYKSRFYNLFTRFLAPKINYMICQSAEMQQSVKDVYGIADQKLVVIANPALPSPLLRSNKPGVHKKLITVCRLVREKGVERLLQILSQLDDNYSLTIVGDGPLMAELKQLALDLKLEARVSFLGEVQNVGAVVVAADVFVTGSFVEGFSNAMLEALSVGVPVVAFRVGGSEEMISQGYNGYISEQDDMDSFKNNIIRACARQWIHSQIKQDIYRRFSLDKIGREYEDLLQLN